MYREFLIETSMKTTIFHTDSDITLDILRKEYPDSEIQIISSGGTKMGTKKSSNKAVASKKSEIDGATEQPNVSAKTQVAQKSISKEAEKIPGGKTEALSKKRRKGGFDEKTEKSIIADYNNKMTYKDLASKYNSSRGSIYNCLVRNGIIHPQKRKK